MLQVHVWENLIWIPDLSIEYETSEMAKCTAPLGTNYPNVIEALGMN